MLSACGTDTEDMSALANLPSLPGFHVCLMLCINHLYSVSHTDSESEEETTGNLMTC